MSECSLADLQEVGGQLKWIETIVSELGIPYTLEISYPQRFPFERPKAFIRNPPIDRVPHRFTDGSLCLFDKPEACDPKCTALVVRNRAVVWILSYEAWRLTGEWLTPAH